MSRRGNSDCLEDFGMFVKIEGQVFSMRVIEVVRLACPLEGRYIEKFEIKANGIALLRSNTGGCRTFLSCTREKVIQN